MAGRVLGLLVPAGVGPEDLIAGPFAGAAPFSLITVRVPSAVVMACARYVG